MAPGLPPLSLYVHLPWCVAKCPYCDFNSHRAPEQLPERAYVDALLADLAQDAGWVRGRRLETVFFGGGTPSLFSAAAIGRVLEAADAELGLAPGAEVTLEANPGTIEHAQFDDYRRAGVNRVSLGVQSFDDAALRRLGRIHGADEARRAIREVREGGIENLNLDLMYALPEQTLDGARRDVEEALAHAPEHVSHYQLTLEPNTLFAARPPPLPDDDTAWTMQEHCQQQLAEGGYQQYEVSAYARTGARCAHNLNYWQFGDYLGIGAGAHGKVSAPDGSVRRPWKLKHPRAYLDAAATTERLGGYPRVATEQLPFEYALNALRLNQGFDVGEFERRTRLGRDALEAALAEAQKRGWLERHADHVAPTALGRRFLNDVIELFMA